jgi:DNA-binding beta-propeller fold protein YncE
MPHPRALKSLLLAAVVSVITGNVGAQNNNPPNPYHEVANWAKLPAGAKWGGVISVDPATDGDIWVFHRSDPPILRFDQSGNIVKSFGNGMFVQPHGMTVDPDGNVWVTDAQIKDGKGDQVYKFSPDGRLLMTLGKAGVAGAGNDVFSGPCDVIVARNGDIFVADGHIANTPVNRIMKFSKDGTFIKAWGRRGDGPGEFNVPHTIFFDSRGRLLVGDRSNRRIQIFDQEGTFLDQWTQFGSPSGIFIAPDDTLYVVDYNDKMALLVGSAKDGSIRARSEQVLAEGVAVDAHGAIYVGETVTGHLGDTVTGHRVKKLVKK